MEEKMIVVAGIPVDIYDKIVKEGQRNERNLSAQIRFILKGWAEKQNGRKEVA